MYKGKLESKQSHSNAIRRLLIMNVFDCVVISLLPLICSGGPTIQSELVPHHNNSDPVAITAGHRSTSLTRSMPSAKPQLPSITLDRPVGSQSATPPPRQVVRARPHIDLSATTSHGRSGSNDRNICSVRYYTITLVHGRCMRQVMTKVSTN